VGTFEGQTAVITGGGTGVGAAVALALAESGADICLIGRRMDLLELVASKERKFGSDAICYPADLATHSVQRELTRQLAQELPQC
jgi:short-subunit dehydrogenase